MATLIWNPWHGCTKYTEGCDHCFMYFLDAQRDRDGSVFQVNKTNFDMPLKKNRKKEFKYPSGTHFMVCMTSDFCYEKADPYRDQVWEIIRQRPDCSFYLLTKRAYRLARCLPDDWGDGYPNVSLNVTTENQRRADERIPILFSIPSKLYGINVAPFIGPVDLTKYLRTGKINQVEAGGENYDGCRPCCDEWIASLYRQCVETDTSFSLYETGTYLYKENLLYYLPNKAEQKLQAFYSGYHYISHTHPMKYSLRNIETLESMENPAIRRSNCCVTCSSQWTCMGCSGCNRCKKFEYFIN